MLQISLSRGDGNSTRLCTSDGCAVVGGVVDDGVGLGLGDIFTKSVLRHRSKNFARRDGGIKGINFWSGEPNIDIVVAGDLRRED